MAAAYRTHVNIIADILSAAKRNNYKDYDDDVTFAHLMHQANVLHSIASLLMRSGLLYEQSSKYMISEKVIEFL